MNARDICRSLKRDCHPPSELLIWAVLLPLAVLLDTLLDSYWR